MSNEGIIQFLIYDLRFFAQAQTLNQQTNLIDFKVAQPETPRLNADNGSAVGLVLRVSQLRGLGAVGDSSTERGRLRNRAAAVVCRPVRLETENFHSNFSTPLP
jgi:hypothetical protein